MQALPQTKNMIITIPFKTPTINHLYGQHGVSKYLKPKAKELRERIGAIVQNTIKEEFLEDDRLRVSVYIMEDWYTKKGAVKNKDVANREKFLIDSVFGALGIDDKQIFEHKMKKVQSISTDEWCEIKIERMNLHE